MFRLPETIAHGTEALYERFEQHGLVIVTTEDGVQRPATRAELGLGRRT
jgi:hypothetical protein